MDLPPLRASQMDEDYRAEQQWLASPAESGAESGPSGDVLSQPQHSDSESEENSVSEDEEGCRSSASGGAAS